MSPICASLLAETIFRKMYYLIHVTAAKFDLNVSSNIGDRITITLFRDSYQVLISVPHHVSFYVDQCKVWQMPTAIYYVFL